MLIYHKETDADIKAQVSFISSCTQITSDILAIPNNPWTINSDPVRYWIANGQDRLGNLQIRIIKFLHQNYFKYGRPVYLKSRSISERMGESVANIGRAISSLVERGIIIRLHFIMDSNNRTMLIPGTLEFKDFLKKKPVVPPSNVFFRKLSKRLRKTIPLYNILLYFKQMYLNLKVSLQRLQSAVQTKMNCYAVHLRGCVATPHEKTSLLENLKNRIKNKPPALPPPTPLEETMKDLLKKHSFDITKLSVKDQNDVIALIDHRMMLDIRGYIRNLTFIKSPTITNTAKKILYRICWLFCHGHDLDIRLTERLMDQWKSMAKGNKRIVGHSRIATANKSHAAKAIISTYIKHKRGEDFIYRGMERLFKDGYKHRSSYYSGKKITFEEVFLNPFDRQIWVTLLNASDRDWAIYVNNDGYKVKNYKEEVEKAKQIFIQVFFTDREHIGVDYLQMRERTFASWINRLMDSVTMYKRNMGDLDLVFHKDNAHPPVLFEYFMWYNTNKSFERIDISEITSKDYWGRFINHMRLEWNDQFWKRESELVVE